MLPKAKTDEQQQARNELKSLLARIEQEFPATENVPATPATEAAAAAAAASPPKPEDVFSIRLTPFATQTSRLLAKMPGAGVIDPLLKAPQRDEPTRIGGVPILVVGGTCASAAIALPLLWLALWPRAPKPAIGQTRTAIVQTVETKNTAETLAERGRGAAPRPQIVTSPAPVSRITTAIASADTEPSAPARPELLPAIPAEAPASAAPSAPVESAPSTQAAASPAAKPEPPAAAIPTPSPVPVTPPPIATASVNPGPSPAPTTPPQRALPAIVVDSAIAMRSGQRIALPLRIEAPAGSAPVERIVLRGLPNGVAIANAARGPAGSLVLTPDALASAELDLTSAVAGQSEIEIELQGPSQMVLARTTSTLAIIPSHVKQELPAGRADALISRAASILATGDIGSARLVLERAAEGGSAAAALALGETYDANQLARRGTIGTVADKAKAQLWYERARVLGHAGAEDRLRGLGR